MDKANGSKLEPVSLVFNVTKLTELTEAKQSNFTKCMSNFISNIKSNN